MKLLTLLTTLIITLASSNVFAKQFVCQNWVQNASIVDLEHKGTRFLGEEKDKTVIIKDKNKKKITLTYFAKDGVFKYYTTDNKNNIDIFSINKDMLNEYDFKITSIWGGGEREYTICNYQ